MSSLSVTHLSLQTRDTDNSAKTNVVPVVMSNTLHANLFQSFFPSLSKAILETVTLEASDVRTHVGLNSGSVMKAHDDCSTLSSPKTVLSQSGNERKQKGATAAYTQLSVLPRHCIHSP